MASPRATRLSKRSRPAGARGIAGICQNAGWVARLDQRVVAWAALAPVSTRACYAGVAEHSIYVDESHRGQGIGKTLLLELVRQAERSGFWTLQSSILPENEASISIHLSCGFRVLGRRKAVARLHGIWRDAVLVERRSRVAGVE